MRNLIGMMGIVLAARFIGNYLQLSQDEIQYYMIFGLVGWIASSLDRLESKINK